MISDYLLQNCMSVMNTVMYGIIRNVQVTQRLWYFLISFEPYESNGQANKANK